MAAEVEDKRMRELCGQYSGSLSYKIKEVANIKLLLDGNNNEDCQAKQQE